MKKFKHMASTNMISDCPILVEDIRNSENMYGPSMEILKGNSTRIKPRLEIKDDIQIPSEIYKKNSNIELCIEKVFINSVSFMVSIYIQVRCR